MTGVMKIQNLNLDLKNIRGDGFQMEKFYDVAQDWVKAFGGLKELSLTLYSCYDRPETLIQNAAISAATSEATTAFRVVPTIESEGYKGCWTVGYHHSKTCVRWTWKSEKGSTLLWKETSH
jgi:hypothetical protein